MNVRVTNYLGEYPHGKETTLSILPCVDFDGASYFTVFDPREKDEMTNGPKQVRCETLDDALALYREIVLEAVEADAARWREWNVSSDGFELEAAR